MKKEFFLLYIFIFSISIISAKEIKMEPMEPSVISPRLSGLGGSFVAMEAGFDTLFTNPAAFTYLSKKTSFSRVTLNFGGPLFELIPTALISDKNTFINSVFTQKNGSSYADLALTGPLGFGMMNKNWAFGIYNKTMILFRGYNALNVDTYIGGEIYATGGYGGTVYDDGIHLIALGVQGNVFFQTFLFDQATASVIFDQTTIFSDAPSKNIVRSTGFGLDFGFLYQCSDIFSIGVTARNIYTPVFLFQYSDYASSFSGEKNAPMKIKTFLPNLSIGTVINIPIPDYWMTINSFTLMIDYRNMLEPIRLPQRNQVLNIALGSELVLNEKIAFRLGLKDLYPTLGIGVDLTYFRFDISGYGKEWGNNVYEHGEFNVDVGFSFEY